MLLITPVLGEEFGQYRYSNYIGVQQQLNNQRRRAIYQRRLYNQNPTRNIYYPHSYNSYPNIERNRNYYQRNYSRGYLR